MIQKIFLLAIAVAFAAPAHSQTRMLRYPTYANGKVAFTYLGDIWIANDDGTAVRRLTDHMARDIFPRFSPDGKMIAFSSNREGNYDVYVLPVEGGRPTQLTFNTSDDYVVGWSTVGTNVIFTSTRAKGVFPSVATLFSISASGGMESSLPTDWGSWASYSPDGSKMAFTRHPGVWSRKHYRGSYAVDLWLMDMATKKYTKLGDPDYKGNRLWPMYGRKGEIYYVADKLPREKNIKFGGPEVMKSVYNIWKISERGGDPSQVTFHTDGNLYYPNISSDGTTIVYEDNFGLWKLDIASGRSTEIPIHIQTDMKDNDKQLRAFEGEAEAFSLSPSGKRAAIVTHGEVFSIATDRGEIQRVTESPWREESPKWSPDGKWIAFVSDRSGQEEIWIADEKGNNLKRLTDVDCDKFGLVWAADSKSMLWSGSDRKLRRVMIEDGKSTDLAGSEIGPIGTAQFSPDGKWISYSKQDKLLRSHVYLKNLEAGEEQMLDGEDFLSSSGASWTPDGKKILLLGSVGAPAMSSLNRTVTQLYSLSLKRDTKGPDDKDIDTEEQAEAHSEITTPSRRGGRGTNENASATNKVEVSIEWDGIKRRFKQLTRMGGVDAAVASPDSKTYAFVAASDTGGATLYTISEDGTKLTNLAQGAPPPDAGGEQRPRRRGGFGGGGGGIGDPQWTKDGRTIYYRQGGGIYSVGVRSAGGEGGAPGGGARGPRGDGEEAAASGGSTPKRISFTVRMLVDDEAERRQVFDEAWRVMKNRFYDPMMHGVDWAAAKHRYEAALDDIGDTDELHTLIMEMIGELNASHTGVTGGGQRDTAAERPQTRYPGFDLEPDSSGCFKVGHIYKEGPADHDYIKLHTGDFIVAVNGQPLRTTNNYWRMFNLIQGKKFDFTVCNKPDAADTWSVRVEPISSSAQDGLDYDRWVEHRKQMVDKLSGGTVGYLHIKAMDAASLQRFQRDLLDNLDKKALVIDERFNGGGGIDQELLEILNQRKKYEFWRGRGSVEISRPVQAFFGPMAVLQNERSASNAEMFPEGFRTLGLGKVIGMPTYGAVIGTGAFRLMDGSSIRTPGFGVYTAKGVNFENYGVQPDVMVDNTPSDFLEGHDRQVEKAVEVLRAELK